MQKYVFVLCPPFSGSTVLWRLLQTSPNVSALPREGQFLDPVKAIMRRDPWNPEVALPWPQIKAEWSKYWNPDKPLLLEKSPPNLIRAQAIEKAFSPCAFIVMIRDPYAQCEGLVRRRARMFKVFKHQPTPGRNARDDAVEFFARQWIRFATWQIENIERLERVVHFTYEEMAEQPGATAAKIMAFLPELGELKASEKFQSHSVAGHGSRVLTNMNELKWQSLRKSDIAIINGVLQGHPELLEFFGYAIRQPAKFHDLHYVSTRTNTIVSQLRNLGEGTLRKRLGMASHRRRAGAERQPSAAAPAQGPTE
jgi:hypothetical protein